jgi:hypothetical protein
MSTDSGNLEPEAPKPDFELPELVDLRVRRVHFEAPKLRNFRSTFAEQHEAVEFVITTDRPIPIRALGPALFVGKTPVTDARPLRKKNAYRFLAFDPQSLKPGAPISLGWSGQPRGERRSQFVYEGLR